MTVSLLLHFIQHPHCMKVISYRTTAVLTHRLWLTGISIVILYRI
jgi:hypothetical protein